MDTANRKTDWLGLLPATNGCRKRARRRVRTWLAAGVAVSTGFASFPASAGILGDLPDTIVCPIAPVRDRPGGLHVYYIDARADDGTAYYKALSRTAVTITVRPDGTVSAKNNKACDGKTIKELREAGRAFDLR